MVTKRSFTSRMLVVALTLAVGLALADSGALHRAQQSGAIQLGSSGINANMCCSAATLGSLVRNGSGQQFILSNNHVLARTNFASAGEGIRHRSMLDNGCGTSGTSVVANLSSFVPINFSGGSNSVDAAIAEIVPGAVGSSILDIGAVNSATKSPALKLKVKKSGRTTGLTTGSIKYMNVTVNVNYGTPGECASGGGVAKFVGQFIVMPGTFSAGGDSGSLIVENVATNPKPVGLLFAGSPSYTIGNPIGAVLGAFPGLTFVGAGTSSSSTTSSGGGPGGGNGPNRPEWVDELVAAVARVKERHSDQLLSVPDSVGHGVGESEHRPGELVITLFVRELTERARRAAPASIEGVRVELVETGEFHALPAIPGKTCGK